MDDAIAPSRPLLAPPFGHGADERSFVYFVWTWNWLQARGTPGLHNQITRWLDRAWARRERQLLLMVFRDAGKSTLVGLYCAWLLFTDPDLRILVVSAGHELACKMTRNVRKILELHPFTAHLLPDADAEWAADRFTVRRRTVHRDPSLLARGIGANVTGARADVLICDDVEVPGTSDTPGKRESLRQVLRELGFVLVPGGLQLYVGTPHSFYSIYADQPRPEAGETVPFLDGFNRLVLPLLDEQGRSRWPERFPPEEVEAIRTRSGPAKFRSQMLLMPSHAREIRLDPDRLIRYDAGIELGQANGQHVLRIDGQRMVSASCWWDPALGRPQRGDGSVIAAVFQDEAGGFWLHDIRYLTVDPARAAEVDEATQLCRLAADFVRVNEQPSLSIEVNGVGGFLPSILRRELGAAGLAVRVVEHSSSRRKAERILSAFDPVMAARRLRANASVWRSPFIEEMREWSPVGENRDDGLDAVSGCLLAQPVRIANRPSPGRRPSWRDMPPTRADTAFDI